MSQADKIREFAYRRLIAPALTGGTKEVTIRAGDVHKAMGLQNSMPNVCSALDARIMQASYGVQLIGREGPHAGANVFFRFARVVRVEDPLNMSSRPSSEKSATAPVKPLKFAADTVYLVSCVKTKRDAPAPARDLYVSDWFKSARSFVETRNAPWFVLSAQYGLVGPDEVIAPYERTLKNQSIVERRCWAHGVAKRLFGLVPSAKKVVMLAGNAYAEFLTAELRAAGISIERPMEGLSQGEQLSWLKQSG